MVCEHRRDSLERRVKLALLRNQGDYKYNIKVLEKDWSKGLVLSNYRSPFEPGHCFPADFAPCEYCRGFVWKKWMSCHLRGCQVKKFYNQFDLGKLQDAVGAESSSVAICEDQNLPASTGGNFPGKWNTSK